MPRRLNSQERQILDFVVEHLQEHTYQPSVREIAEHFGLRSTKTVHDILHTIAGKGWIKSGPPRSRGLELVGISLRGDTVPVPQVAPDGRAALDPTGSPLDTFELDRRLAGPEGAFLLAMTGNTLESEGIRDGDLLLVEPASADDLEEGEIAVVLVSEGARVARFRRRAFAAAGRAAGVRGKVVGVIRHMPERRTRAKPARKRSRKGRKSS